MKRIEGPVYEVLQVEKPQVFRRTVFTQDDSLVRFAHGKGRIVVFGAGIIEINLNEHSYMPDHSYRKLSAGLTRAARNA